MDRIAPKGKWRGALGMTLGLTGGALACQTLDLPTMTASPPGRFVPEEDERRLWSRAREAQEQIQRSGALYHDAALTEYVDTVARRIAPDSLAQAGLSVEVRIIRNPSPNAFTLPNGAIYIHTGLLAQMESEAQLATLLGHELAHVIHRHPVRHLRDVQNKTGLLATFGSLIAPFGGSLGVALYAVGALGTVAAITGYSQDMEAEADREGLALMMKAGYDPTEAPKLFLHLKEWAEGEKKEEPFFFSSHPRLSERIESYQELLKGLPQPAARGGPLRVAEQEFRARTRGLLLDNAVQDLHGGRFSRARKGIERFLALNPRHAQARYYLAETYRRQNDPKDVPEAIRHYHEAIALDGNYADPHRGLGTIYLHEDRKAEAVQSLQRYLELAPGAPDHAHIQNLLEEVRK